MNTTMVVYSYNMLFFVVSQQLFFTLSEIALPFLKLLSKAFIRSSFANAGHSQTVNNAAQLSPAQTVVTAVPLIETPSRHKKRPVPGSGPFCAVFMLLSPSLLSEARVLHLQPNALPRSANP